ncbi:hypothetical protein QYZ88_017940 [Lachnospiraceae bacterium C1.1]|nr:hypothetical protein [Lachnospiraceae bacterium C1.1]
MGSKLKKYLPSAIVLLTIIVSILNCVYNSSYSDESYSLKKPDSQAMYTIEDFENGSYPDLFLRVLVRDKKVILARAPKSYSEYSSYGHDDDYLNPFDSGYFKENNFTYWFMCYADSYEYDPSLPTNDAVSENMIPHKADFTDFGEANDMLRYSFPLNHEHYQEATAFWYSWYYHTYAEKVQHLENVKKRRDLFPNVYVNTSDIAEADTLVALIAENEDLYLMSRENYDRYMNADS